LVTLQLIGKRQNKIVDCCVKFRAKRNAKQIVISPIKQKNSNISNVSRQQYCEKIFMWWKKAYIAVHFAKTLKQHVTGPFVVMFDQSLHKKLQDKQMDLVLRFWSEELHKV